MYQIAICDDDKIFLQNILSKIERICKNKKILFKASLFSNGESLVRKYEQRERFDLVILDISMPVKNGKQIAEQLRKYDSTFELVFISSLADEVFNTFSYGIASFIPKMNLEKNFEKEFIRVIELHENKIQNTFLFKRRDTGAYFRYSFSQIVYVESVERIISLHLAEIQIPIEIYAQGFEALKKELSSYRFVEIHRTCIVNVTYIYCVNETDIKLTTGEVLQFSRRRKTAILEAVSAFVSEVVI